MNKSEPISFRCLPEEKRALARIARQERRTVSEQLRQMIRDEAKRRKLWPPVGQR